MSLTGTIKHPEEPKKRPKGSYSTPRNPKESLTQTSNPPILRNGSGGMRVALESATPKEQCVWNGGSNSAEF